MEPISADAAWHTTGYAAVQRCADAFLEVASSLDEREARTRVPGQEWTGHEVVSHVLTVCRRYLVSQERASSVEDLARLNAAELRAVGGSTAELGEEIRDLVRRMAVLPAAVPPGDPRRFHAGQSLPLAGGWGNLVGELVAHGHDLHALGGPAPTVDGRDLEPLWRCTLRALGPWLSPTGRIARERWVLDLGFPSGPVVLGLAHGTVSLDADADTVSDSGSPERRIAGDAVDVTLAAIYHRRPLRPVPAAIHDLASRIRDL